MTTSANGSRRGSTLSVPDLVRRALAGQAAAVARLISLVEDGSPSLGEALTLLAPHTGRSHVIGVTGAPGVGKSTLTGALITALRSSELRVGVLAVDPSSPFTGGALLGDRIRMSEHAADPGVFIRSMASRGHLGGLARATPQAIRVLDAVGFDVVLVETVGVGQSEVEVAAAADTTVVLLAPGMGDGIQAAKAGLLEVGDVYVVNKADRDGAGLVRRDLRSMLAMTPRREDDWSRPVLKTVAQQGTGIDELVSALTEHRDWAERTGETERRRSRRIRSEIQAIALAAFTSRWEEDADPLMADLVAQVGAGRMDPYRAAARLLGAHDC